MENTCMVFYDSWQMECCGTPFSTGDLIEWLVCQADGLNSPVDVGILDYYYEAHSSDWRKLFVLSGTVESIKGLYQRYLPSPDNPQSLLPVDGKLLDMDRAEGFEEKSDEMEISGYLVSIRDYTIRPAKKKEVTFR